MPDHKMMELCRQIATEQDSAKLLRLVEELNRLLAEEHDTIKQKIRAKVAKSITAGD